VLVPKTLEELRQMLQQGLDVSGDELPEDVVIDPNEKASQRESWGESPLVKATRPLRHLDQPFVICSKAVPGRGKVSLEDAVAAFMDEFEDVHWDGTEMVPKAEPDDPHGLRVGVDMAKMRVARREARHEVPPGSRDAGRARKGRYTVTSAGADAVVHFGKHRDHPLSEIAKEAPDYLRWMLKEDFDEDLKAIVRRVLKRKSDEDTIGGLLDDPDDCPF